MHLKHPILERFPRAIASAYQEMLRAGSSHLIVELSKDLGAAVIVFMQEVVYAQLRSQPGGPQPESPQTHKRGEPALGTLVSQLLHGWGLLSSQCVMGEIPAALPDDCARLVAAWQAMLRIIRECDGQPSTHALQDAVRIALTSNSFAPVELPRFLTTFVNIRNLLSHSERFTIEKRELTIVKSEGFYDVLAPLLRGGIKSFVETLTPLFTSYSIYRVDAVKEDEAGRRTLTLFRELGLTERPYAFEDTARRFHRGERWFLQESLVGFCLREAVAASEMRAPRAPFLREFIPLTRESEAVGPIVRPSALQTTPRLHELSRHAISKLNEDFQRSIWSRRGRRESAGANSIAREKFLSLAMKLGTSKRDADKVWTQVDSPYHDTMHYDSPADLPWGEYVLNGDDEALRDEAFARLRSGSVAPVRIACEVTAVAVVASVLGLKWLWECERRRADGAFLPPLPLDLDFEMPSSHDHIAELLVDPRANRQYDLLFINDSYMLFSEIAHMGRYIRLMRVFAESQSIAIRLGSRRQQRGSSLVLVPNYSTPDESQRIRGKHFTRHIPTFEWARPSAVERMDFGSDLESLLAHLRAGDALYTWSPFDDVLRSMKTPSGQPQFTVVPDPWSVESILYCAANRWTDEGERAFMTWFIALLIRQWRYLSAKRQLAVEILQRDPVFAQAFAVATSTGDAQET